MNPPLRVGIGVSADSGWAGDGHVPAVQGLAGLELAAVPASNQEKADAAAKAFAVMAAFANSAELIHDRDIDLVVVCVRVPDHRELVMAAIAAGKHVYCESPLGKSMAESEEMALPHRLQESERPLVSRHEPILQPRRLATSSCPAQLAGC